MSTTSIGDTPAFPNEQHQTNDGTWNKTFDSGMTYRMWLIGQIAPSMNDEFWGQCHDDDVAAMVVNRADAIIERLDKEMGEK